MARKQPPAPTAGIGWDAGDELAYSTDALKSRLKLHPSDDGFFTALTAVAGGSLHPDHGGSWDRMKKASAFLEPREQRAPDDMRSRVADAYLALPVRGRGLVDTFGATAGIPRHVRSGLLTDGEARFYEYVITTAATAGITDTFDAVVAGFNLDPDDAATVPGDDTGTSSSGGATASPDEDEGYEIPQPIARIIDPDITFPDGYTDGIVEGTATEIKDAVWSYCHRLLVAELQRPKPRKSVYEFLAAKCKGFKIPDEWRNT